MPKMPTTKMFRQLGSIQTALKEHEINEQEYKFLVGFLLQHEINSFIHKRIDFLTPTNDSFSQATMYRYQRDRRMNHA